RDALRAQVEGREWLIEGAAARLAKRLDAAEEWRVGDAFPKAALVCHDGMGMSGPSRGILGDARTLGFSTLFTGHLPEGSPGAVMVSEGRADWIRLPTHPTLAENRALTVACAATTVLGHSCDPSVLRRLGRHMPMLRVDLATGDCLDV
ncbi:MAG TPA: MBL fold metallo-hydrolase, partial [Casimicrobiaceae bacterium]|nr:MBL fold metallo-hydrolase [Casimicrobiaceae bacterium]